MLLCLLLSSFVTVLSSTALRQSAAGVAEIAYKCHAYTTNMSVFSQSEAEAGPQVLITKMLRPSCLADNLESLSLLLSNTWEPTAVAGRERAAGHQLPNPELDAKPLQAENSKNPETQNAVSPIRVTKHVKKQPCLQDTKVDQGTDKASCLSDRGKL
ncbi:hypothetical protein WISP_125260 [Willisornis vidua]|uniref:Uncharacterized protein n=1 Tax=Willisornis vidua TaxID=1566151 RepID=A0ABQ9CUA7_9PASS|nr:hypothetical protein WISP_125260 [Willisornis vidua]